MTTVYPVRILKEGAALWQKRFASLSGIFLVFYIPVFLFALAMQFSIGPKPAPEQILGVMLVRVLVAVLGVWAAIALMLAAAQESPFPIKGTIMQALKRFWPYAGAAIIMGSITAGLVLLTTLIALGVTAAMAGLGPQMNAAQTIILSIALFICMAAAAVAACILSLRFLLFGFICVIEQIGPVASLKRSWALTRKRLAPIIGTSLLIGLIFFLLMFPLFLAGFLAGRQPPMGLRTFFLVYSYAAYFVAIPLQTCVFLKLYHTLKEAVQ